MQSCASYGPPDLPAHQQDLNIHKSGKVLGGRLAQMSLACMKLVVLDIARTGADCSATNKWLGGAAGLRRPLSSECIAVRLCGASHKWKISRVEIKSLVWQKSRVISVERAVREDGKPAWPNSTCRGVDQSSIWRTTVSCTTARTSEYSASKATHSRPRGSRSFWEIRERERSGSVKASRQDYKS